MGSPPATTRSTAPMSMPSSRLVERRRRLAILQAIFDFEGERCGRARRGAFRFDRGSSGKSSLRRRPICSAAERTLVAPAPILLTANEVGLIRRRAARPPTSANSASSRDGREKTSTIDFRSVFASAIEHGRFSPTRNCARRSSGAAVADKPIRHNDSVFYLKLLESFE